MLNAVKPNFTERQANAVGPLTLAHIGDAVYELLVRTNLVFRGPALVDILHQKTVSYVNAEAQAKAADRIQPHLSEEEIAAYKRGRNCHSHAAPHHTSEAAYHKVTGLECLFGWLYLRGRIDRINELFEIIWEEGDNEP